jgi:hypothetical protein
MKRYFIVKGVITAVSNGKRMPQSPFLRQFGVMPGTTDKVPDDEGGI